MFHPENTEMANKHTENVRRQQPSGKGKQNLDEGSACTCSQAVKRAKASHVGKMWLPPTLLAGV